MQFVVTMPDEIAAELKVDSEDASRRALELFAIEGYRQRQLSRGKVGKMLGLSFHETEELLKTHKAWLDMSLDDVRHDVEALERFLAQ